MSNTKRISQDFAFRTKDGIKRPTVTVEFDVPTVEGVQALLVSEDPKVVELVTGLVGDLLTGYIRTFVDADDQFDQSKLEELVAAGKVSIEAIANLPKSERNTITKEHLEEFAKDYIEAMVVITGKDIKKVQTAASLFMERFKRVAGENSVLAVLQEQLGVFIEGAGDEVVAKHEKVLSYLASKLEELLSVKVTADAL